MKISISVEKQLNVDVFVCVRMRAIYNHLAKYGKVIVVDKQCRNVK